jgi:hypothetical protein
VHFFEAIVSDIAAGEALTQRANVHDDECDLLLVAARLNCSFLFDLLLHDMVSLGYYISSGHLLLHELQNLIFMAKAHQLILDDCFDLFF